MRESTEDCFTEALTTLVRADAVQEMIKEKFIFTGFAMSQPPVEQFAEIIALGNAQATLYFVVVQHDAKVQLLRRQNLNQEDSNGEALFNFIQECVNLFTIMAEEDPGYLQAEVLTNAGLGPVNPGADRRPS